MEIAKVLNRAPHTVIEQLKTQKIVKTLTSITGYAAYKQTPLYTAHAKAERAKQKDAKEKALEDSKYNVSFMKQDIHDLKDEVASLNNTISTLQASFDELLAFTKSVFVNGTSGIMQKAFSTFCAKINYPIQGRRSWH
jgi:cell division protein FtsB